MREQPGRALVDGRRAHLDRGRGADRVADRPCVDARPGQGGDLRCPRAGEVDARRGGRAGRAARDRAVDDLEAALLETGGDLLHRGGRGRVQVGDERRGAGAAGSGRDVPRDRARLPGRHDREDDPGGVDHVVQAGEDFETGRGREPPRSLAPPGQRGHDPRASGGVRRADGAPHRPGPDEPDRDDHAGTIIPRNPPIPCSSAPVAQWTERRTSNPRVGGSNPPGRILRGRYGRSSVMPSRAATGGSPGVSAQSSRARSTSPSTASSERSGS